MVKVRLKGLIKEYSDRNKDLKCNDVYSVTNSDGFIPSSEYFSKEVFSKDLSSYKKVYKNSLAFNPSRINVGSVAVQSQKEVVVVSPLYTVLSVEEKYIFPLYLECFLHSNIGLQQIKSLTEGSVRDILKFSSLEKMEINLPSLEDQKNFISKIGHINKLIVQCEKQLSDYDLLIKSRFIEMFGDPVTNPNQFPKVALSELADIKIGPFGSLLHKEDYIENGHPIVNPSHIIEGKIAIDTSLTISNKKYMELGSYQLHVGDVVLGRRGEMGRCAVVLKNGLLCGTGSMIIRTKGEVTADFIQKIISFPTFRKSIENMSVGQTMPNLNVPIVSNFFVIKPPIEVQKEYYVFIDKIVKSKLEVQKSLEELETLKKSLMQQYFG